MAVEIPDNVPDDVKKAAAEAEVKTAELLARRKKKRPAAKATPPAEPAVEPLAVEPTPGPVSPPVTPAPAVPATPTLEPLVPTVPPEPQPTAVPAPVAAVPPQPAPSVEQLRLDNARLERQLNTFQGIHGSTIQQLRQQVTDLTQKIAAQPAIVTPQPIAPTAQAAGEPTPGTPEHLKYVTKDLVERYGEEFFQNVALVARGVSEASQTGGQDVASAEVTQKLDAFRAEMESGRYWSDVDRLSPGASVINGDPDKGMACAPGWGMFLDTPVAAGSSLTKRDEAERAAASGNAPAFAALVNEFKASRPQDYGTQSEPTRPTVQAQAVPHSVTGSTPPTEPAGKRKIPQSEIIKFQADCNAGKVPVEKVDAKMLEYKTAHQEGRVQMGV